jgi:hypothetical protein
MELRLTFKYANNKLPSAIATALCNEHPGPGVRGQPGLVTKRSCHARLKAA